MPEQLHLWLGSGHIEIDPHRRRPPLLAPAAAQLVELSQIDVAELTTEPVPCAHCEFCTFAQVCEQQWRDDDSLVLRRGSPQRRADGAGRGRCRHHRRAGVARRDDRGRWAPPRATGSGGRAGRLQVEARPVPDARPAVQLIDRRDDAAVGPRLRAVARTRPRRRLPRLRGPPVLAARRRPVLPLRLCSTERRAASGPTSRAGRTTGRGGSQRRRRSSTTSPTGTQPIPGMHVYHYNHTERSSLERLTAERTASAKRRWPALVDTGAVRRPARRSPRNAVQVGTESYGLKHLERLTDFVRGHDIDPGAGAVVEYEQWTRDRDPSHLDRIAALQRGRRPGHARAARLAGRPPPRRTCPGATPRCSSSTKHGRDSTSRSPRTAPLRPGVAGASCSATCSATGRAKARPQRPRRSPGSTSTATTARRPDVITGLMPGRASAIASTRGRASRSRRRWTSRFPPPGARGRSSAAARRLHVPVARRPATGFSGRWTRRCRAGTLEPDLVASAATKHGVVPRSVVLNDWVRPEAEAGSAVRARRPRSSTRARRASIRGGDALCCAASCPRFAPGWRTDRRRTSTTTSTRCGRWVRRARPQLRRHPGPARHRQDVPRRAHRAQPRHRRQARRHHRDQPRTRSTTCSPRSSTASTRRATSTSCAAVCKGTKPSDPAARA